MRFNEKLINLRNSRGMSQDDLAEKLNVTTEVVSRWELDQTTPDMGNLMDISKLFSISLDELVGNFDVTDHSRVYENYPHKKTNTSSKKRAAKIFVVGLIIGLILCGIGLLKQEHAKKTNEKNYNEAYEVAMEKYNSAMKRIDEIDIELSDLNSQISVLESERDSLEMGSEGWFEETERLNNEIFDLTSQTYDLTYERNTLEHGNYTFYYDTVDPMTYKMFYYIGAGVFSILALTALIYYLVTVK